MFLVIFGCYGVLNTILGNKDRKHTDIMGRESNRHLCQSDKHLVLEF